MMPDETMELWDAYLASERIRIRHQSMEALERFINALLELPPERWHPWARDLAMRVIDGGDPTDIRLPMVETRPTSVYLCLGTFSSPPFIPAFKLAFQVPGAGSQDFLNYFTSPLRAASNCLRTNGQSMVCFYEPFPTTTRTFAPKVGC
ncbi:hypothetical protein OKA05_04650 [Luteolibacter arcticus]|uniref:Uncharacterized protein n=1 Tax=Luteolibacter arcticus TaxID=1581411 RepID=A0ABT3GE31_9BACT|nr:hypothetical protein [Luteolibacter arcticus]MCW1921829.1 hypothetical protein [Luteolibacter arcticus]